MNTNFVFLLFNSKQLRVCEVFNVNAKIEVILFIRFCQHHQQQQKKKY